MLCLQRGLTYTHSKLMPGRTAHGCRRHDDLTAQWGLQGLCTKEKGEGQTCWDAADELVSLSLQSVQMLQEAPGARDLSLELVALHADLLSTCGQLGQLPREGVPIQAQHGQALRVREGRELS